MFDNYKEQLFVDDLDKYIKFKNKQHLIKLYYSIKRCKMRDMVNISIHPVNEAVFTQWNKRTNFKNIKRVGYKWDDGVIVVADIISDFNEENKNRVQLQVKNIGTQNTAHLMEPFWLALPNPKLCKPTKEIIQQSHYETYNKWMMILNIKNKQHSTFEDTVFDDMVMVSQIHPQLIFTVRHRNYTIKLEDKTYDHVLQSLFTWSLSIKCRKSRCHRNPKLNCHCEASGFQHYTYCMIRTILYQKSKARKNKDSLLEILKINRHDTETLTENVCAFLPASLRKNSYIDKYKEFIQHWLLHDFYNIICSHCGSVNKSIMINRVFHYSSTLRNCRTCGVIVRVSNCNEEFKEDIYSKANDTKSKEDTSKYNKKMSDRCKENNALKTKAKSISGFCKKHKEILKEEDIKVSALKRAMNECVFSEDISQHKENELLNFITSLLTEQFDELTYYLSRFLDDINEWKALRIKITANHYFFASSISSVSVHELMNDAGIHPHHANIFKDCWTRALFQSIRGNKPLIDILDDLSNPDDERKSNNKKDVLCIDHDCLQIYRKLSASISSFTIEFIEKLKEISPNHNIDLFGLIKRFSDFKIDANVFPVLNEVELLSLIWNKWEYLDNTISISYWNKISGVFIKPQHKSLQDEVLSQVNNLDARSYKRLLKKAKNIAKQEATKRIRAKKSQWGTIIGMKHGTPITLNHVHALLLFADVPELRHKIRRLLTEKTVIQVHVLFGHLFRLLMEIIYVYGDVLNSAETIYYSMDQEIILDKFRGRTNVPILGSNKPSPFRFQETKLLAECETITPLPYFDITSIIPSEHIEQRFYLFFGAVCDIRPEMHMDRLQLTKGSECRIHSNSRQKWFNGKVMGISKDDDGEWLNVTYGDQFTKEVQRLDGDLSVIQYDKWYGIMRHFGGNCTLQKDPFLILIEKTNIFDICGVPCTPECTFRINTILTYYKKSQNIIPDFDVFIQDTKIDIPDHSVDRFREIYSAEREKAQKKQKRVQSGKRGSILKTMHSRASLKLPNTPFTQSYRYTSVLMDALYHSYDVGVFMRYDVNNPRFESLAEEVMFNEVINISNERFNQHLVKAKEIYSENCLIMLSTADDFNFGITKYQPISISHIIAIIIHTEEPNYSREFTRSFLLIKNSDSESLITNHCNNFYWLGRYLFECIEYFGETLDDQTSTQQRQGLPGIFKFDLFAPPFNFPRSTTKSMDMALHYASVAGEGCVLEFCSKYNGVLNSTKFMDLGTMSEDYDADTRLFFGRRCATQINNIVIDGHSLRNFILPLLYLEKIMLQTILDRQFFNSKHLYDIKEGNKAKIQGTLVNLISAYTGMTLFQKANPDLYGRIDKDTKVMIIRHYFPTVYEEMEEYDTVLYAVDLLKHWCSQRTFITFESFEVEFPFMIQPLREYFVSKNVNSGQYQINITELQLIMPNLKNYRDFNKRVVGVPSPQKDDHVVRTKPKGIIDTIDENLHDYYRSNNVHYYYRNDTNNVGIFRSWCDTYKYDDIYIERQIQSFKYCDKHILKFDVKLFKLADNLDDDIEGYQHVWEILCVATKPNLLKILYSNTSDLEQKQCENIPRSVSTSYHYADEQYEDNDAIYRALSNCQRHEIPDEICDILDNKLGFFSRKSSDLYAETAKNGKRYKKKDITLWKSRNRRKLVKFYEPISKLQKASRRDFLKIAQEITLFDEDMMERLCDKLMERLFTDIERMKQWRCNECWFRNRKMMIGGLWCLYNQLNECGLCGKERKNRKKRSKHFDGEQKRIKTCHEIAETKLKLPTELKAEWNEIQRTQKDATCTIGNNIDETKVFLERFTVRNMKQFITTWLDDHEGTGLKVHKNRITQYFDHEALCMNAASFLEAKRTQIAKGIVSKLGGDRKLISKVNNKLLVALTNYIKSVTMYCKPLRRIAVILNYYHLLTETLCETNDRYSCSIRQFLSAFDKDSRVQLLDAFEHVLHHKQHKPSIIDKQPYIPPCSKRSECIHRTRVKKSNDKTLSMPQKQKLFNCDDWKDHEYILYLDKMHCAILHNDKSLESVLTNNKEKQIIRRYSNFSVYSTGVYIDHSSLSSLHVNLKEELINNSVYTMDEKTWENSLEKAKHILSNKRKEETKWIAKETNEIYGIKTGDRIQIEHILVIYLYTSNTLLCTKFRESYRSSEYDDNNQNVRSYHINNFYWMGRFIYAAIQFFGQKPRKEEKFYHGLGHQFLFTEFSTVFETPTSTSKNLTIVQNQFARDNGIVLTLGPKFKNELNNSKYLDVSAISTYGKEEERLFAGMTVLAVIDITYHNGTRELGKSVKCFLYFERIVEQTIHNKHYYNYGFVKKDKQKKILLPLIEHQMRRNGWENSRETDKNDEYLYALFEHFCDSKQEFINLSCIYDEIETMHTSIRSIFFKEDQRNDKLEINDKKLQFIFPKLKGYKNHLGYWIHFEV